MTTLPPHRPPTQPGPTAAPAQTEPLAIASLILGVAIVLFGALSGIAAIVCGFLAVRRIKREPTRTGTGMAITGILLGSVSVILTTVVVAMLLALMYATTTNPLGPGGNTGYPVKPVDMYYYDLGSDAADPIDRLFVGKSSEFPPIPAPSGQTVNGQAAGVRAWVWSCGECSDRSKRFVGYLETFTPEAQEINDELSPPQPISSMHAEKMMARDRGHLVATPEEPNPWVHYNSAEGTRMIQSVMTRCGGEGPRPCYPAD